MATRQRTFFDTENKAQTKQKPFRSHFPRTRSASDVPQEEDSETRLSKQRPAIPVGSQSNMKLKAFQFVEGRPGAQQVAQSNDENDVLPEQQHRNFVSKERTPMKAVRAFESIEGRPPPATPVTRLPLSDLIGNPNDRAGAIVSNVSPEEHVLWVHAQGVGSSQPVITPARNRKHARSSSPPSSQHEQSNFSSRVHGKKLNENAARMIRTPQADPAADLWQRYANANEGPGVDKSTAFAHLIRELSPKSPATAGSVGGLRRWSSCGIEWPQSAVKRRRITKRVEELPKQEEAEEDGEHKTSRVGMLLERMKETLTKPSSQLLGNPSGSSPSPERNDNQDAHSPLQRLATVKEMQEESQIQRLPDQETEDSLALGIDFAQSSEYGDNDMDMDMLEEVDNTVRATQIVLESKPPQELLRQPPAKVTTAFKPPQMAPRQQPVSSGTRPTNVIMQQPQSDEFGDDDDDDDLFAAVEQIAAQYDSQPKQISNALPRPGILPQASCRANIAPAPTRAVQEVQVISDDEFGDEDIDDDQFAAVEAAATQAYQASGKVAGLNDEDPRIIQRYLITAIQEGTFVDEHGRLQNEKVLIVDEPKTSQSSKLMLRQSWFETPATVGSYVHVTGDFESFGHCIIDNSRNILILHPDHLISATVVADSFGCVRRAVLQDRVKATGEASPPMMYGHIIHELFQEAMKANEWGDNAFEKYMVEILPRHYETMVEVGLNLNQVYEHLRCKVPDMRAWADVFVRSTPRADAVIRGRNGQQSIMSINKLLDVEEHIWSPNYGLKGNVDATIQATIADGSSSRVLTVPFELKTGKRANESHVAQTALYTLLTSDRYDVEITEGVLYYLENSQITRVQAIRHELIHLIMKRNELACYVRERLKLPPMLPEPRQRLCNKCYAQTTCFLYHKLAEDGTSATITNKGKFEELVKYLTPMDQVFFKNWDQLLTKEESEMKKFTRELWTMLSHEREKKGRCFGNVVIEMESAHELQGASKINRFQYTFTKQNGTAGFSFTESQITVGEPIVVSDERGHYALANGYVTGIHKKRITVAVDRRLHNARTRRPGFNSQNNQDFIGFMEALPTQDEASTGSILYRLDKDEFSNGMATARNNVLQIMNDAVFKAADLRAMIVHDRAPKFTASSTRFALQSQAWQTEMNTGQKAAVEKVMAAQDYALVLGMPGTGKTTTIAQIISALVAKGKSVLLTSYTHTAVDNILLKLRNTGFDILRLGVRAKIHPQVQEFAVLAAQQKGSLEELQDAWYSPPVVATTCLGVNHPIFVKRTFDYCIVDEASQLTMPVCLGPIRMAKIFILVGDHFQLPPLVQNKEAQEGGLDISLFRLLSERHPEAVVDLEHQYRMCADIMHLSNSLIYSGRLKCGTEAVARQALEPPYTKAALSAHHSSTSSNPDVSQSRPCVGPSPSCHLYLALQPQNNVLFLNTDTLHPASTEILSGPRITNPFETSLTSQLTLTLLASGVPASEIGVITFYRSQLAELRQQLRATPGIELHTADKFQGRDKEAVIVSFVRSNREGNVGELLKDWRRINVAVTRAKSKLILVGSKKTLRNGGEVLKGLVEICEEKGWMHDLRSGEHYFSELVTQLSGWSTTQASTLGVKKGRSPTERTALGDAGTRGNVMRIPEKKSKVGVKGIAGARPVLRDIMHEVLG